MGYMTHGISGSRMEHMAKPGQIHWRLKLPTPSIAP